MKPSHCLLLKCVYKIFAIGLFIAVIVPHPIEKSYNASFHKRKDILNKIESELPNIRLEFLPVYSPDYNLIELVWHSAKEYIAHKSFESVEQLENLLNKLLNEGELIIKWERKLKNKGNAVYSI